MSLNAILHVGMPKCGSSALQTALSLRPDCGPGVRYVAFHASAEVLCGAALRERAGASATGYVVSARAAQIAAMGELQLRRLRDGLARAAGGGATLVLSNEGWGNEHADFAAQGLLGRLGIEAEVVLYVRPQAGWFNSAWWQWGAWNPRPFERWLRNHLPRVQWGSIVESWAAVPGVRKVHPRLLPQDVLADFRDLAAAPDLPSVTVNTSLPEAVLRLFQRHRRLREGPHASAIEFSLARQLRFEGAPAPWVLRPREVKLIVESCRAGNEALATRLDASSAAAMRADAAWWEAAYWNRRPRARREPGAPDPLESERLAAAAIEALFRLDGEHRALAARLREAEAARAGQGAGATLTRLLRRFRPG